jgi:hypothetical protein
MSEIKRHRKPHINTIEEISRTGLLVKSSPLNNR